jgi:hypothetical protein
LVRLFIAVSDEVNELLKPAASQGRQFGNGRLYQQQVGTVSSLMQEAAVRLIDAANVGNAPHC